MTDGIDPIDALWAQRSGTLGGKGIAAKMARLRDAIGPLEKDRRDTHLNRRYTSTKAIAESVREAAQTAGVSCTCHQRILESSPRDGGGGTHFLTVQVTFVFTDPETGEFELM